MSGFTINKIDELIGKTFKSVLQDKHGNEDVLLFELEDGMTYQFYHSRSCCENVEITDICGTLSDLEGSPIIEAEERVHDSSRTDDETYGGDSTTWTFYSFATAKGAVVVRWTGSSNGYYSETVSHGWAGYKDDDSDE